MFSLVGAALVWICQLCLDLKDHIGLMIWKRWLDHKRCVIWRKWEELEFAPKELSAEHDTVLRAVKQNWQALEFAAERLRDDREIVEEALQQSWRALRFASHGLRSNRDIVLKAVKESNGWALEFAAEELYSDNDIVREASTRLGGFGLPLAQIPTIVPVDNLLEEPTEVLSRQSLFEGFPVPLSGVLERTSPERESEEQVVTAEATAANSDEPVTDHNSTELVENKPDSTGQLPFLCSSLEDSDEHTVEQANQERDITAIDTLESRSPAALAGCVDSPRLVDSQERGVFPSGHLLLEELPFPLDGPVPLSTAGQVHDKLKVVAGTFEKVSDQFVVESNSAKLSSAKLDNQYEESGLVNPGESVLETDSVKLVEEEANSDEFEPSSLDRGNSATHSAEVRVISDMSFNDAESVKSEMEPANCSTSSIDHKQSGLHNFRELIEKQELTPEILGDTVEELALGPNSTRFVEEESTSCGEEESTSCGDLPGKHASKTLEVLPEVPHLSSKVVEFAETKATSRELCVASFEESGMHKHSSQHITTYEFPQDSANLRGIQEPTPV